MPAEAPVDVPDMVYQAAEYEAAVARLRALGCRCPLRCQVADGRLIASPLNDLVGDTCLVDHKRSYTT